MEQTVYSLKDIFRAAVPTISQAETNAIFSDGYRVPHFRIVDTIALYSYCCKLPGKKKKRIGVCQLPLALMRRRDWTNVQRRFSISRQRQRYAFWRFIAENTHRAVGETRRSRKTVLLICNFTQVIEALAAGQEPCNRARKKGQ